MLRDVRKDCFTYAKKLGDYQSMDETQLMDGYCDAKDAGDKDLEGQYFSAMVLRKWYTIHSKILPKGKLYGIEDESDAFAILVEAIQYADKYRAWRDPNKKCSAQSAVNQCITTICEQHRYQANLDIHKASYSASSLDEPVRDKDGGGSKMTVADTIGSYEIEGDLMKGSGAKALIQECIRRNRPVEAIFLDLMAYNDVLKHSKKVIKKVDENGNAVLDADGKPIRYTEHYTESWDYKTIQLMNELNPDTYLPYLTSKYIIPTDIAKTALDVIIKANNQKKYRYLRKTREYSKQLVKEFLLD